MIKIRFPEQFHESVIDAERGQKLIQVKIWLSSLFIYNLSYSSPGVRLLSSKVLEVEGRGDKGEKDVRG